MNSDICARFQMVETQKNKKNLFHYACQYGNADMINLLGFCAKTIHGNDKFNTDKLLYEKLQSPYTFYYDLSLKEKPNSQNIKWKLQCVKLSKEITNIKIEFSDLKTNGEYCEIFYKYIPVETISTVKQIFTYLFAIHIKYQSLGFLADKVLTVNKNELLHYISGIDTIIEEITEIAKGGGDDNRTFTIFNISNTNKIIKTIKEIIDTINKKVDEFNNANKEIEKLSLELQKESDNINKIISKTKDTRKKYEELETKIKTSQNKMNPLDVRQTQIIITQLKADIVSQEKEKNDISEKLSNLKIQYRPQLQKYQMLEDTLYNKNDDQLFKDKAIKYELNSIMIFLEQFITSTTEIQKLQFAINDLNKKLSVSNNTGDNNNDIISLLKKMVALQVNKKYPFGDYYFNIMTVFIIYVNYNKGNIINVKNNFESKLPSIEPLNTINEPTPEMIESTNNLNNVYNNNINNFINMNNITTRLFNFFTPLLKKKTSPTINNTTTVNTTSTVDTTTTVDTTGNDNKKNKKKKNKQQQQQQQQQQTNNQVVVGGNLFESIKNIKNTFKKNTKHLNLSNNFEEIIVENIKNINNSQYNFVYKILLQFKEQLLQKTTNINNPYYFNFIFASMSIKYLYQDYYNTIDSNIYNFINTDVYSKDLKNDIFFIYGKNSNVFIFNNTDKEYEMIIKYLQSKYKNEWNSHLTTNNPNNPLITNLKSPIENEIIQNENEKIENENEKIVKGGGNVLLQTDIIYKICTPLFLAYQYQKINSNSEFIKAMKTVFYDSYNFAIENDPNRVLKTVRSQILYNSIKNSFDGIKSIFKKTNKLKNYNELLKQKKPGVCHDIEEKFNLLKDKCKPHDYSEDIDSLYDIFISSFNKKQVPLEHKIKLDVYPSIIDENKMNIMISDDIKGDTIVDKIVDIDNAIALNPFLEPSINALQPIQENIIDVTLPDLIEQKEEDELVKETNKNKQKSIKVPSVPYNNNAPKNDNYSSYFSII